MDKSRTKEQLVKELRTCKIQLKKFKLSEEERQQAEEALRESEAKYRQLVQTTNTIILQMDTKGYMTFCNRFAQDFFGFSAEELIGKHVLKTIVPERDSSGRDLAAMMADILKNPEQYSNNENENICRNGERVWVAWTNMPIFDRNGKFVEILCIGNDITRRKKAEEKLLRYQERLRSLASELPLIEERNRRQMATHLHDGVGQILATAKIKIESLIDTMRPRAGKKDLSEAKDLLEQAIQHTRTLISDLSPPILYELGLEAAVEWLLEHFHERHGVKSDLIKDRQTKPLKQDVEIVLFHAVRELMMNIVKHSRTDKAQVSIRKSGDYIEIKVKDYGVGFNGAAGTSRAKKIKSFGLFSIREKIRHLGGRVIINAQPKKGTEVTLLVPLAC